MMRWMDSVMLSHDPLNGVYSGMMPWSNSQTTKRPGSWPARLLLLGEGVNLDVMRLRHIIAKHVDPIHARGRVGTKPC